MKRYRHLVAMVAFALTVGALLPWMVSSRTASASTSEPPGNNIAVGHTASADSDAYPVSPAGQAQPVEDKLSTVKDMGGLGAFYWEPGWYAVPGAGWIGGQGDGWENMAQVDQQGNALQSLSVYSRY